MSDLTWTKRVLADVLGEDRGMPDFLVEKWSKFTQEDLDELRINEREAVLSALARVARQSRDARGADLGEGAGRPDYVPADIEWGMRAARAALEAQPAGERSEKANQLLSDCECPSAVGPDIS